MTGVVAALAIGLLLQPFTVRLMTRVGAIDTPNARSSHAVPTPRAGGFAVVLAALVGLALAPAGGVIALPLIGYAAIGLADDLRGVRVAARLAAQYLVGLLAALVLLLDTGWPAAYLVLGVLGVLGLACWLTAYVNAFNFMDGLNGMAAAHAIVGGLAFAVAGALRGLPVLAGAGLVIAAAALSFLPWNAGRARIFLGDVGSYGLGGALAVLAAYAVLHGVPAEAAIAPLALYLVDTGSTLLRRIRAGERWYEAHRTHVYQRLTDLGWSHSQVAFGTAGMSAVISACGLVSIGGSVAARVAAGLIVVALLMLYCRAPSRLTHGAATEARA